MKNILFYFVVVFVFSSCNNDGLEEVVIDTSNFYEGNVYLTTQQEVDEFGALGYNGVDGSLTIGKGTPNNSITNLNALSNLKYINGNMLIQHNYALTNLEGFNNLSNLEGQFSGRESKFFILDNPYLTNIDAFANLKGRDKFSIEIRNNLSLSNIDGLISLKVLDRFDISNNNSLLGLDGMNYPEAEPSRYQNKLN